MMNADGKVQHATKPERRARSGAVLLSHNHIALLQALVGFTDQIAPSTKDWVRAAVPLASGRFWSVYGSVYPAVKTLHPSWVSRERRGNKISARLSIRGRKIVSGEVRARIIGVGLYVPTDQIVKFGVQHAAKADCEWWTAALETIALRRAENSPRYDEYHGFLERYLTPDDCNTTGFELRDLSPAKKWLLLVVIDEFLDQEIVSHQTFREWIKVWRLATQTYAAGYEFLRSNFDAVDPPELERGWTQLRASVS
jgi:hypothetical protein